jgi:hypothetical protein
VLLKTKTSVVRAEGRPLLALFTDLSGRCNGERVFLGQASRKCLVEGSRSWTLKSDIAIDRYAKATYGKQGFEYCATRAANQSTGKFIACQLFEQAPYMHGAFNARRHELGIVSATTQLLVQSGLTTSAHSDQGIRRSARQVRDLTQAPPCAHHQQWWC